MSEIFIPLGGGVDGTSPETQKPAGRLRVGRNVEAKPGGGYRRIEGYSLFDENVVPGEGAILGVHYYGDVCYAFRNAEGNETAAMYASTGSGWTPKKSGLAPYGRYRCINYAFSGAQKMYGASGVHKAFQYDGTTWTDIDTTMTTDTPSHIIAHKKHLFLSFNNSLQHSSLGVPTSWSPLTSASEILLDHAITGFATLSNGSLGVFTREGIMVLGGSSVSDWVANNLVEYGNRAGALPDTIQAMGSAVRFTDSRGVIDMAASDVSSDFQDAIISTDMDAAVGTTWQQAIASCVVRAKGQYRVFFSTGTGVIGTFVGDRVMWTELDWPHTVRCCHSGETSAGVEVILFGSDDGYIYQMEDGRTFGGTSITAYAETALTDLGYRHNSKRLRRIHLAVGAAGNTSLEMNARLLSNHGEAAQMAEIVPRFYGAGTFIGPDAVLGKTLLGGQPVNEGRLDLPGTAMWVSFRFQSTSTEADAWEIDGVSVEYMPGKRRR